MSASDAGAWAYVWPVLMLATFGAVLAYAAVDGWRAWRASRAPLCVGGARVLDAGGRR